MQDMNIETNTTHNTCYGSELLTEAELIVYLRIPEITKAKDFHNVIENLKRMRDLPCIHICNRPLYPRESIRKWIEKQIDREK
jgi:hypothetical protein